MKTNEEWRKAQKALRAKIARDVKERKAQPETAVHPQRTQVQRDALRAKKAKAKRAEAKAKREAVIKAKQFKEKAPQIKAFCTYALATYPEQKPLVGLVEKLAAGVPKGTRAANLNIVMVHRSESIVALFEVVWRGSFGHPDNATINAIQAYIASIERCSLACHKGFQERGPRLPKRKSFGLPADGYKVTTINKNRGE